MSPWTHGTWAMGPTSQGHGLKARDKRQGQGTRARDQSQGQGTRGQRHGTRAKGQVTRVQGQGPGPRAGPFCDGLSGIPSRIAILGVWVWIVGVSCEAAARPSPTRTWPCASAAENHCERSFSKFHCKEFSHARIGRTIGVWTFF